MTKIFLSGPMFSPADLWEQGQIDAVLVKAGYETYLASRDGIEDDVLIANLKTPLVEMSSFQTLALMVQKLGWTLDIYMATYGCDGMVFNMNGRVPDEGSVAEVANAYAAGMPIVTYKSTSITMWGPFDNPMVAALNRTWHPVTTYDDIVPALAKALAGRDASYRYVAPPYFAEALEIGKFVHEHRDLIMKTLLKLSGLIQTLGHDLGTMWHWILKEIGLDHLTGHLLDP
jgi:nucleoside 2-deoxyribosyltransferase